MDRLDNLLEYINKEIEQVKEKYNIEEIKLEIEKIKENLEYFDSDIEKIDLNVLEKIFKEAYLPELATKQIELFKEIINLKEFLTIYKNEYQIQNCLKNLEIFKQLFKDKILNLENKLTSYQSKLNEELDIYSKFLNYFNNNKLIRILNNDELENLIDFIISSDLDREIVSDLIVNITISNIELYDKKKELSNEEQIKQIRKNASRISKLVDLEIDEEKELEKEENEIEKIENLPKEIVLTEEEQQLYNEVFLIYETLKQEKLNTSGIKEILDLIDSNDLTFSNIRYELYYENSNLGNRWAIILLDLENNLLKNYKDNKEDIGIIFKNIIKLFKERFISKNEFLNSIKELKNRKEINRLIASYDNLSTYDKNSLISIKTTLDKYGKDSISGFNLSYDEYVYYTKIEKLKDLVESYDAKKEEDIENDKELADILILELNSLYDEINLLTEEIKKSKIETDDIEDIEDIEIEPDSSYKNLLLFLPYGSSSVHDTINIQIEELRKNYRDNHKEFISQNIDMLERRILKTPFRQMRNLSKVGKKHKNGILESDKSKPKFKDYDVFRYKQKLGIGARLIYMIIPISDKNKEMLKKHFNMNEIEDICLVLNQDASFGKEKGYVKRAHDVLVSEEKKINQLIEIFANDFTEQTFEFATSLIENSLTEYEQLKYNFLKKEENIIGGSNNE